MYVQSYFDMLPVTATANFVLRISRFIAASNKTGPWHGPGLKPQYGGPLKVNAIQLYVFVDNLV